ncbi:MAG: AbrB family transcriptional regulator [Pyrobaculum sp.]
MKAKVDKLGRLLLPKKMRRQLPRDYVVELPDGILLIPKPEDPVKLLVEEGKKIDKPYRRTKKRNRGRGRERTK